MTEQPKQRIVVDAVAFSQVFQFHRVLRSITQAMQPPRLIVGLFMVLALAAVGNLWDDRFDTPTVHPEGLLAAGDPFDDARANAVLQQFAADSPRYLKAAERNEAFPVDGKIDPRELLEAIDLDHRGVIRAAKKGEVGAAIADLNKAHFEKVDTIDSYRKRGAYEACAELLSSRLVHVVQGLYHLNPETVFTAFADLILRAPVELWSIKPWFVVFYGLFAVVVVAVGGGALTRMSVCEIAGRERLRVTDGFDFSSRQWVKLVLAVLLPLIIAGSLFLLLAVVGKALFFLPFVNVLGGVLYVLNLVLGFLIAFVLLAYGISFPMVLPAVATECADPADALQRAFAYLLSRPLHYLGYVLTALVAFAIGYAVVGLVAATTINVTGSATSLLEWESTSLSMTGGVSLFDLEPNRGDFHSGTTDRISAFFVSMWQGLVIFLVAGYIVSFIFTASSHIYMLMRKTVDDQDFADIWRPGLVPGTLAPMPSMPRAQAPKNSDASRAESSTSGDPDESKPAEEPESSKEDQ